MFTYSLLRMRKHKTADLTAERGKDGKGIEQEKLCKFRGTAKAMYARIGAGHFERQKRSASDG